MNTLPLTCLVSVLYSFLYGQHFLISFCEWICIRRLKHSFIFLSRKRLRISTNSRLRRKGIDKTPDEFIQFQRYLLFHPGLRYNELLSIVSARGFDQFGHRLLFTRCHIQYAQFYGKSSCRCNALVVLLFFQSSDPDDMFSNSTSSSGNSTSPNAGSRLDTTHSFLYISVASCVSVILTNL